MNVGFIGLGIMGAPMALHLLHAGHHLFVHTRSQLPATVAASAAVPCASQADNPASACCRFTSATAICENPSACPQSCILETHSRP